jgi:1,4-dihydroxy-2-naphthoate octaprenyltransferase
VRILSLQKRLTFRLTVIESGLVRKCGLIGIDFVKASFVFSRLKILFLSARPKFLTASVAPVLVGSAVGYAVTGTFQPHLFVLALLGIMALHSGANITNDYFDHLSGNDWVNKNPTPFSGGRRFIQQGILSAKATFIMAMICLAVGSAIGLLILYLTRSVFILILGIAGLLGGFFYTARPIQLGYRCFGEFVIAMLFGLFPVYGSYYLQAGRIDAKPLLPAVIVSILIFLVILINEFPDRPADAQVNKRTLVVWLGVPACVWIYRVSLSVTFAVAVIMLTTSLMFFAGLFYLLTLPLAVVTIRSANRQDLSKPGYFRASAKTVLMHTAGSLALAVGMLISAIV